jgi:hypothetical protein
VEHMLHFAVKAKYMTLMIMTLVAINDLLRNGSNPVLRRRRFTSFASSVVGSDFGSGRFRGKRRRFSGGVNALA